MIGEKANGLYLLNTELPMKVMHARSLEKPTTIDVWHRQFGHAGVMAIRLMGNQNLVDGLDIKEDKKSSGQCEDCIYGKQTQCPYDEVISPEKTLLERVHIDIHGPTRVR